MAQLEIVSLEVNRLRSFYDVLLERIKDINDYLKDGQQVKVKVIQTDEKGRVRLSAKALLNEGGAPIEPIQPTQQ